MIIFTAACCVVLACLNFYLNYVLYQTVNGGGENLAVSGGGPMPYEQAYFSADGDVSASRVGEQAEEMSAPPVVEAEAQPLYRLGMKDGFIAVYYASGGGELVKEVTGLPADALPFDEKLRLTEGIPVYDDTQLAMLLQDYGS
jgi:hypothetical protein